MPRSAATALVLLALLGLPTAAAASSTRTRVAPDADFASYETFRWREEKGPAAPDVDGPVRAAAVEALEKRGLRRVGVGEPADLELQYVVGTADLLTAGLRIEADWWGSLWAVPAGESYVTGGIAFALRDLESGELVFAGARVVKGTNDNAPIVMRQRAPKYARQICERYPGR